MHEMTNSELHNASDIIIPNVKQVYDEIYYILYGYVLPTICVFGFFGNVMNLIILAGKHAARCKRTERSVNCGLIALAFSDLMFCICVFPSTFLPKNMEFESLNFLIYYGCYCAAIISIFIMTSTWLTVTMSTERYLAVCHPLKSRNYLSLRKTKIVIVSVFFISTFFNIPTFWRFKIYEKSCNSSVIFIIQQQILFDDKNIDHAYRACWAVFGNIIPLVSLLFFNVMLWIAIKKSLAARKGTSKTGRNSSIHHKRFQESETSHRVTITLIAIVVMFFIFVAPSEVVKHAAAALMEGDLHTNYLYQTFEIITNVMQTINFTSNFILYCIINPSFRKEMKHMICFQQRKRDIEATTGISRENSMQMKSVYVFQRKLMNGNELRSHNNHLRDKSNHPSGFSKV